MSALSVAYPEAARVAQTAHHGRSVARYCQSLSITNASPSHPLLSLLHCLTSHDRLTHKTGVDTYSVLTLQRTNRMRVDALLYVTLWQSLARNFLK